MYLIDIIPLIEMLWSDGKAQESEVVLLREFLERHVVHINRMAGYRLLKVDAAWRFVERFLRERPDTELLGVLRSFVAPVRLTSGSLDDQAHARDCLLAACLDIASSAVTDYPYAGGERFCIEEKQCFFEILGTLEAAAPATEALQR
ncbi:MAG: hypothetical protein MUP74_01190 [Desulfobacterales bacterium]|nr:hypothetical protein [Desulfobacterales bacterium]